MKLQDSLYRILAHRASEQGHEFMIGLDAEHLIYKAHFPGEPITPGVCILQMALELLEVAVGEALTLVCAKNVKFLRIITPREVPELCYKIQKLVREGDMVRSQVVVSAADVIFAKLSCELRIKEPNS